MGPFALQKYFGFLGSHLLIVDLSVSATAVLFKKSSSVPMQPWILLIFSSNRFSRSGFMLRFLIHLDMSSVQDDWFHFFFCILLYA